MNEITRSPLCWPNNIPRRARHQMGVPQFRILSIAQGVDFVIAEICRLNNRNKSDKGIIISSNLRLRQDGLPVSAQNEPQDPGVAVFFTLQFFRNGKPFERPCVLSCDRWSRIGFNLHAIAKDIEAQRGRQRWGCTSIEQAFQGYLAIPEHCGGASWWEALGIPSTATRVQIEESFKRLAMKAHPDKGGSAEAFARLRTAYDQAMAAVQ